MAGDLMLRQILLRGIPGTPPEHTVTVDDLLVSTTNGTTNYNLTAAVTGGVGPFTYSWFWASGGIGIELSNTTSPTVSLASTGTDQVRTGVIQCDVTDTGNGNLVRGDTGNVQITHGTPA